MATTSEVLVCTAMMRSPVSVSRMYSTNGPRSTMSATVQGMPVAPALHGREGKALVLDEDLDVCVGGQLRPHRIGKRISVTLQPDCVRGRIERSVKTRRLADEARHERRGRMIVDRLAFAHGLELAAVDDGNAIAHRQRLFLIVRDVHERNTQLLLVAADFHFHLVAQLAVEIGQGLVEQQQRRMGDEATAERHALLLAARELIGIAIHQPTQRQHAFRPLQPLLDFLLGLIGHAQREGQVLAHGTMREQQEFLKHHADTALVRGQVRDIDAGKPDASRGRSVQSRNQPQQRALARTARPEDGDELVLGDIEAEIVQRHHRPVAPRYVGNPDVG